jgi:hypothetical protein
LTISNSSGTLIGGVGSDGLPRFSANSYGTITGTGAATYTVTFSSVLPDTSYYVFTSPTGTSNTTACTLNVGTLNVTNFVVTPSAPTAFPAGRNIFWWAIRTN